MTSFKILTTAAIVASVAAISPSIAQQHGGRGASGGVSAPNAGAMPNAGPTSGASAGAARMSTSGTAGANVNARANVNTSANVRTSQNFGAPPAGVTANTTTNTAANTWQGNRRMGTWRGNNWNGRVAANGNWNGGNWDWNRRRFNRGPGFAVGFGVGAGYPYYDDYAYAPYPYDAYASYDDPYYSDTFVETAPAATAVVTAGGDAQAYCMQRFRSYDPASGTYLGYDGVRHPCP